MAIKITLVIILSCALLVSSQFKDDMQTFEQECLGEDKLACMSGGCVLHTQYCDGVLDCEDGTDENFCFDKLANVERCNATHQFMCEDKSKCIPNHWICNKEEECNDGSDELDCTALPDVNANATCKGFKCGDGRCISNLWVCDGKYDCEDKSDEYAQNMCRHTLVPHAIRDGSFCQELLMFGARNYKCSDSSYCLPSAMMCDGIQDCRDGSDEGPFCDHWQTMCSTLECHGNDTKCSPERHGPTCICLPSLPMKQYNNITHKCEHYNECLLERPQCSHMCENAYGNFTCKCDEGYARDESGYLCNAPEPEALLFFSTRTDIRYLKVKSKQVVNVTTGIKDAHGVSYDGTYLYWVQTAQGHQAIYRAHLDDISGTKEVLVGLGLEEPGDIAVDWLGGHIYFSDVQRGTISACRTDGSMCTTIHTSTKLPKFVTLDVRNGKMYWADWHQRPLIMTSAMDGSNSEVLVDNLGSFATGLAIDVPNDRLYYVDRTVKVVVINGKRNYSLFEESLHHPYTISVFENTVFWSDWTSNTIQTTDKLHGSAQKRNVLLSMNTPVFDMHIYHPILMKSSSDPCKDNNCSHFCFITSNVTHVCGCPDGMEIRKGVCVNIEDYHPQYLIIGGEQLFTLVQFDTLGNPETHATHFDIGRVQAMTYDNVKDTLYIYDGHLKCINYIEMKSFTLGLTSNLVCSELENVLDMDYDYVTNSLYILDAGRLVIEVFSLRTNQRALIYSFKKHQVPVSLCVMPDYGRMLVAVAETEQSSTRIDIIGLDGGDTHHILMNNLKGPEIHMRYAQNMDNVYISDEGNGAIDYIHPEGTGRENFRKLSTTIRSLAVSDSYVFWTDRRTPRLFWSDIHETTHKIRRIDLSMFPNNTQLFIQSTSPHPDTKSPLYTHPCLQNVCSDVCTQIPHSPPHQATFHMGYKCHCPPGVLLIGSNCTRTLECKENELHCYRSHACVPMTVRCDYNKDCEHGEDEEGCPGPTTTPETPLVFPTENSKEPGVCPAGFRTDLDHHTCVDLDECANEVCSQGCINVIGSFFCSCHHGYALRSDSRSCKALRGNMSILYVSGNTVRSITSDGSGAVEYSDPNIASITDLDVNVRKNKLYVTSSDAMKLIEVNSTHNDMSITNVGRPTKVAVDWVTDNVYFIDSTPSGGYVRVCNVESKRCAKLQKLPSDAQVTAFVVEPSSRRIFYCVTRELESVVWSSSLAGRNVVELTTVGNCTGLAVDSFARKLYVAETGPARIIRMDFEGDMYKKILADQPQLEAPHGLAIFEDSIYYLVANSFKLSRCLLFGSKHCETYIHRVFDANTFVIRHQSVQRDDLKNECEGFVCSNVCALDKDGPQCICDDGSLAKNGVCALVKKTELPLFNGWTYQELMSHDVTFTVIKAVLVLFVIYLAIFIYYHFVYKPRKSRASAYSEVRFQNSSPDGASFVCPPTVDISAGGDAHEFVNPLQYVRNIWQQSSRKRNRPACTEGLTIDAPHIPPQDFSDTESDYDDRENKKLINSLKSFP